MLEMLQYGFMQRAFIASVLVGTVCSVIGVYVVLRGLSFIGSGIAHASFGGVALGFLLGINPLFTAVIFSLVSAGLIHLTSRRGELKMDISIGIFFAFTMALGILFIGLMRHYDARLYGYLFGNILGVTDFNIKLLIILTVVVLTTVGLLFKELQFITFDEEMAEASGIAANRFSFLLLILIALAIVVSIKAVGIILVMALIVTPAASAYQLTGDFKKMFPLSLGFGISSCLTGLFTSYWFNIPSGAAIVIIATLFLGLTVLFSPKRIRCKICGKRQ